MNQREGLEKITQAVKDLKDIPRKYADFCVTHPGEKGVIHDKIAEAVNDIRRNLSELDQKFLDREEPIDWEHEPELKAAYLEAEKILKQAWAECTGKPSS